MSKKRNQGKGWTLLSQDAQRATGSVSLPPEEQRARLSLEKRNRGKVVTLIANLQLSDADLKALARDLKVACGTGGTSRGKTVELQGDRRDQARSWLQKNGWGVQG